MFSWGEWTLSAALLGTHAAQAGPAPPPDGSRFVGVGRAATPREIGAWDIDVRPDFKGLPSGAGSVATGQVVWEGQCASCHGTFGESNEVFIPIVGGTTQNDIETGHAARLNDKSFPSRTTLMKLSSVSTLWDYIRRAMPWAAPKSLSIEEVYGVTAYLLNMGSIVPDGFTLSDRNIDDVQQRLPNRHGMTTDHALWPGPEFGNREPDVRARACMTDCTAEPRLASSLPDLARNSHGNLADQNRSVGAQHGADTSKPANGALLSGPSPPVTFDPVASSPPNANAGPAAESAVAAAIALTQKYTCVACHGVESKIIGPALRDVARKYAGRPDAVEYLTGKIMAGGSGVWGAIAMPAQALGVADAKAIAQWLADGAKK